MLALKSVSPPHFPKSRQWLNQRDLVRTMNDLVEDYIDDDSDPEESYDSDDSVFTS